MPIAFAPYRFAMRTVPTFVVAAIALLALSGCQPDAVPIIPDPVPTSDLLFESEEEALAAAEEAYGAYVAVIDAIFADGGKRPERLLEVATGDAYESELKGFRGVADSGWHSIGVSTLDSVTLQSYDSSSAGEAVITIYACNDVSGVDVVDSEGRSVVSTDRPERSGFQLTFDYEPDAPSELILSEKIFWTGEDFCHT